MKKTRFSILCALMLILTVTFSAVLTGCDALSDIPDVSADLTPTEELVIYIPPDGGTMLRPAIQWFREAYPDIQVTVSDFDREERMSYTSRVNMELMAGTGPDVIFPHSLDADQHKLMDAGMFLNLTGIMEEDEDFNRGDYFEPVLDGGIYRGRQYVVPYGYNLHAYYLADAEKLREIGFDPSQAADATSFLAETARTLPEAAKNAAFQNMFSRGPVLYRLFAASGLELIDWEKKTALPDKDGFRAFCEAYKPYYSDENTEPSLSYESPIDGRPVYLYGTGDIPSDIAAGSYIFWDNRELPSVAPFSSLKAYCEPVSFVPQRADGGVQAWSSHTAAVRASSKNQRNAYEFIKFLLSGQMQDTSPKLDGGRFGWFPVRNESRIMHFDYDGSRLEGPDFWLTYDQRSVEGWRAGLSEEEMGAIQELTVSADACSAFGEIGLDWVRDMLPYFKDERSLDDCIKDLEFKLLLYLEE